MKREGGCLSDHGYQDKEIFLHLVDQGAGTVVIKVMNRNIIMTRGVFEVEFMVVRGCYP